MKKFVLTGAMALLGLVNVSAQESGNFKLGAHVGLPVGDLADVSSANLGVDVAYVFPIAENFKLGVTSGYSHYFGKKTEINVLGFKLAEGKVSDFGIIPLAATGQYQFGDSNVFLGLDLGYAFSTQKDTEGGFLYQPKLGYTFENKHDVSISYKGITRNDINFGSVNLGYAYNF